MPTLVIDDVPAPLYDHIQRLALAWERSPAATVVKVLETALRTTTPSLTEGPRPQEPFLTEEICAPFTLPRPKGERVVPIEITERKASPHDLPETSPGFRLVLHARGNGPALTTRIADRSA